MYAAPTLCNSGVFLHLQSSLLLHCVCAVLCRITTQNGQIIFPLNDSCAESAAGADGHGAASWTDSLHITVRSWITLLVGCRRARALGAAAVFFACPGESHVFTSAESFCQCVCPRSRRTTSRTNVLITSPRKGPDMEYR